MPRAIALGADGNIWFGEFGGGKIGRITPQGVITEFPIPTPDSGPRALAAGPDGNIWFSEFNASKIGRITPAGRDHRVRAAAARTRARATSPPAPTATCGSSSSRARWTAASRTAIASAASRWTGEITEFPIPSQTGSPINIAVGPDRNIWFTKGGVVGRVTPDGAITEFPLSSPTLARPGLTAAAIVSRRRG